LDVSFGRPWPGKKDSPVIPLQHLHPMIVHFPIVLVFLVAGFELVATATGRTVTGRTASGNFAVGLLALAAVASILAVYLGDVALTYAEAGGFESDIAEIHETLGKAVAIAVSLWALIRAALWWRDVRIERPLAYIVPVISIIGAGLITWTAYYGGQLVFDLGVNVTKAAGG
jgi:uncharacterized membrane protein